ncbi:uncharacterized protein LOC129592570 isoform X1 [Paramacrobiotus metropolitanus]|uniref:uncharacterized protein LOC129592570 isoform X1 n=1 Tax=Paramacrobiotus metropolitanus TaxID=2943436 RepID=UPI002446231B|nr:uncharacterized protein LOC129592570 isoform X1 [Paramacrobiotus metropolitanus]XP_055344622.1 uncharacterized protein LOC129592570 isoform X1 [Paramacrobiotus metropolitanus]
MESSFSISEEKDATGDGLSSGKRKLDQTDFAENELSVAEPTDTVKMVTIPSSPYVLEVKVQAKKYFPFSKRCAKIQNFRQLPKLDGHFHHGGYMYQLAKRDFKEEFELLPRCGQKSASQSDVSDDKMERRLSRIYARYMSAFEASRYLELFRSELGSEIDVACAADLDWRNGHAQTAHLSLGAFARFFARAFERGHTRYLDLNPFESYFLADCGTLQLTLSHCPMGVEDVRAFMEHRVYNFVSRYAVFSELQRTTRYQFKRYSEQQRFYSGQWIPLHQYGAQSSKRFFQQQPAPSGNNCHVFDDIVAAPKPDEVISCSGFALSMRNDTEKARNLLQLPPLPENMKTASANTASVAGSSKYSPLKSSLPLPSTSSNSIPKPHFHSNKGMAGPFPKGIDMAFYGCEKSMTPVPPAFDVAISDYRNDSVCVSALFDAMEKKKNPRLPVLMERIECGQLSGYALILTQLPSVQYAGHYAPFVAPSAELFDIQSSKVATVGKKESVDIQGLKSGIQELHEKADQTSDDKENADPQWIPPSVKRRMERHNVSAVAVM